MEPDTRLAPRVLLAVSDPALRHTASASLRDRGYSVSATTEPDAALTLVPSFEPDVVLVDLDMEAPDGGNLFDAIRSTTDVYVVGMAAPDAEAARIRALRAGADDVVSTSLHPDELAARCQALLRRPRHLFMRWDPTQAAVITYGDLSVDVGRREIRVRGRDVAATRIEFSLFEQLCRRPTEVCTRAELLQEVWGNTWSGDTHVVDVHLSNLRRKLQQVAPELRFIHSVRGVGFRLSNDLLRAGDADQRQRRDDDRMLASA